jgi:hypothetical protein
MDRMSPEVNDRDSAIRFVKWCVEKLGLGYHPDTRFGDYVETDGTAVFTGLDATRLDELTGKAREFIDPTQVGVQEFQRVLGQAPHP